jgi:hypothetical protein
MLHWWHSVIPNQQITYVVFLRVIRSAKIFSLALNEHLFPIRSSNAYHQSEGFELARAGV